MKFCQQLSEYLCRLSCTGKELCALAGISAASFSRYKNGERVPELGTPAFEGLCRALGEIAEQRGYRDLTADAVRAAFAACEDFVATDKEQLRRNFNTLVAAMGINLTRLCQYTNYDPSTIFRIRNGSRRPADSRQFAGAVASFVAREVASPRELEALAELLACPAEDIADLSFRYTRLCSWLMQEQPARSEGDITDFLSKLDEFDLNEYIKAIHFDELKVPSMPFQLPTARYYYGLGEMMDSELDFLKATVLSRSMEPVTMYSDMPMGEMAKDPEFPKKWMFGMAMMLKKGLHLNQIHNLDRSFEDMMLGLESWIPMYMTGQISPYYLKNAPGGPFLHLLKVSGAAALSGEAIAGRHAEGRYYLTKNKRELDHYAMRARALLDNAYPLMDIYRSDRESERNTFLMADTRKPGHRRSILSTLPLYTASEDLLERILARNGIDAEQKQRIKRYAAAQRQRIMAILAEGTVEDESPAFTPEEFREKPPVLELSGVFCEADIPYSQEEYTAHLNDTKAFAAQNPNYSWEMSGSQAFRNLQILIHQGRWVMVSKGKAPAIHFVIRHPKLRYAIESFIPPITEHG